MNRLAIADALLTLAVALLSSATHAVGSLLRRVRHLEQEVASLKARLKGR